MCFEDNHPFPITIFSNFSLSTQLTMLHISPHWESSYLLLPNCSFKCGLLLGVVNLQVSTLEKTDVPSPNSFQMALVTQLEMGFCPHFHPHHSGILPDLNLHRSCARWQQDYEFCKISPFFQGKKKKTTFLYIIYQILFKTFSSTLFQRYPSLPGRDMTYTSHLGISTAQSPFYHMLNIWGALY